MKAPITEILLAGPRGFCAGVERAIDIVELALSVCKPPVYVRREIVHNRLVVETLRQQGAIFVDELDEVPDDATVIFSAHGISPAVREEGRSSVSVGGLTQGRQSSGGVASSSPSMRPKSAVPELPTTRRCTCDRNCCALNSTSPR